MHHNKKVEFEYSQITKYIYIGTNMCCTTHFDDSLLRKGIKANINLEKERIDHVDGVTYHLWLPTKDEYAPKQKQLRVGIAFLEELRRQKVKCYVHCRLGHGRAPVLVAAYFINQGMSVQEAIAKIKQKRPVVHPNKRQVATLQKFAQLVKKKK